MQYCYQRRGEGGLIVWLDNITALLLDLSLALIRDKRAARERGEAAAFIGSLRATLIPSQGRVCVRMWECVWVQVRRARKSTPSRVRQLSHGGRFQAKKSIQRDEPHQSNLENIQEQSGKTNMNLRPPAPEGVFHPPCSDSSFMLTFPQVPPC